VAAQAPQSPWASVIGDQERPNRRLFLGLLFSQFGTVTISIRRMLLELIIVRTNVSVCSVSEEVEAWVEEFCFDMLACL
jgi:hypothetical protein